MGMVVDETGRHRPPLGIDCAGRGAIKLADFDNFSVFGSQVTPERRHAGAIDNQPVLD